ncbi:MAG: tRNA (adenosine(37)-N6)-threonylcarbamoyltransferase complex ATPase subunit type 1 TsaE [Paracoccus sp. (in: a-proteobacteria)]|nr:tRNA (adenosine(37)-N6)-threonylcarbamoyltransferase complex ATPase subunit type 1 TsaE [Paracoccus sp. (in: a-proteobacteria)]
MPDALLTFGALDERQLATVAAELARHARAGDSFLLGGPVGAGKSHFARAFIRARLGNPAEDVPSPTFTLVQTYDAPDGAEIWHADLYRLTDPAERDELGLTDAMSHAICLIEWPGDLADEAPDALRVTLTALDDLSLRQVTFAGGARWADMLRAAEARLFADGAGWADAQLSFLAGDASARRYFRLHGGPSPAVLMDAPPGSLSRFAQITDWLRARGFHAPEIYAQDDDKGLMLLEDLGDDLVARALEREPSLAVPVYTKIAELLADLHRHAPPDYVRALDAEFLAEQVGLFSQHYPAMAGGGQAEADRIAPLIAQLYRQICGDSSLVLSLRDFHAENIVLLPDNRLGLLDYQDAVAAHPAYDLVSALHDVRRDVAPDARRAALDAYLSRTGADREAFSAAFALLGAQRNLRIMGIFTRLAREEGKRRYLAFMPRVWALLTEELSHPALGPLRDLVQAVPAPDAAIIERIAAP